MAILAIRSSSVTCVTFHAFLFCFTVLAKQYLPGVFMQLRKLLFAVLLVLSALPCLATHMAVVVDKSNGAGNLASADLARILQSASKSWPDGRKVTIVLRDLSSSETGSALEKLFKFSSDEMKAFFQAHRNSIVTVHSDEELLKIVESTPGALGLVDVYSITSKVNVVKVDGKLPLEQGYLLH